MAVYLGNSYIGKIAISMVAAGSNLQTKTVTPNTSTQTITPDTGYTGLGTVKVNPIPSSYIQPSGSLTITSNGTKDVTSYASVNVNVPVGSTINNQSKTITPSTSQQVVSPDSGYTGLDSVTVNAIPSSYVQPSATKGATTYTPGTSNQTIAAGTYLSGVQTIKGDSNLTAANIKSGTKIFGITGTYTGSGSGSVSLQTKTNISPTEQSQTITPDSGYSGLSSVQINAISSTYIGTGITRRNSNSITEESGVFTIPSGYYAEDASCWVNTASMSYASHSISNTGVVNVILQATTPGYIQGQVYGTFNIPVKAAATITPGTSNQTIASGTYLTGTQTIKGDSNLIAANIASGISIFGVSGSLAFQTYYTGSSAPASSLGTDGDVYLEVYD